MTIKRLERPVVVGEVRIQQSEVVCRGMQTTCQDDKCLCTHNSQRNTDVDEIARVNGVRVVSQDGVHGKHLDPVRTVHISDGVQAVAFLNTDITMYNFYIYI